MQLKLLMQELMRPEIEQPQIMPGPAMPTAPNSEGEVDPGVDKDLEALCNREPRATTANHRKFAVIPMQELSGDHEFEQGGSMDKCPAQTLFEKEHGSTEAAGMDMFFVPDDDDLLRCVQHPLPSRVV